MASSFFRGTDAELQTGSDNFATRIAATPAAFGLTAPQAASYGTLNTAWQAAYTAAKDPGTRTKGIVAAKNAARDAVRISASNLAKIIDGTSTVTDQQKIDLGLNVRSTPTSAPPPGTPYMFKVGLSATGAVTLGWKCNNPPGTSGTIYQVWRRIGAAGEFNYLGGAGIKSFIDETIPAGSSQVTYKIQAVRSTAVGDWAECNVNFGTGGSGAMITSVEEMPAKKAA